MNLIKVSHFTTMKKICGRNCILYFKLMKVIITNLIQYFKNLYKYIHVCVRMLMCVWRQKERWRNKHIIHVVINHYNKLLNINYNGLANILIF